MTTDDEPAARQRPSPSPSRRSVVGRAMSLLNAFRPSTRELTLGELSRRSGLPTSTAYRLATELVESGALERVESGGYRIGLRLWEIGALADRPATMTDAVVPFMQDLYEVTHENVQLAVLDGREALYIERIYGSRSTRVRSVRGGRLPLHATGVGKVLLAHAPPALTASLLDRGLQRFTPYTLTGRAVLEDSLAEVRRAGVAYAREELTLGVVSAAAPVLDATGSVVAALSVVASASRHQLRHLGSAVRTAGASASRTMREADVRGVSPEVLTALLSEARQADA